MSTQSADKSRRSFSWKLGAGVSAALTAPAVMARVEAGDTDNFSLKVARLEEEKTLRRFHQTFEHALDNGRYAEVVEMFTDDAKVVFNGGVFDKRSRGVSRLYRERFAAAKTGKQMAPAPGFELGADPLEDSVEVAEDRLFAEAVFPYSIQVGMPIESVTSLASMARLHGEGVKTWWEGGLYNVAYRKDAVDAPWKISSLEYKTLSRADYRAGRSYAKPIAVAPMTRLYPEDPQGPDALAG